MNKSVSNDCIRNRVRIVTFIVVDFGLLHLPTLKPRCMNLRELASNWESRRLLLLHPCAV